MTGRYLVVDMVVVGSGAGGMTAALTARAAGLNVVIAEKTEYYGGSTALSGGAVWIPNNPELLRQGLGDDPGDVRTYLRAVTQGQADEARIDVFVDAGPEAMRFLETSPHLRFKWVRDYCDYHPELPGGRAGGRSVEALPLDLRQLGGDEGGLRPAAIHLPMGLWITAAESRSLAMVTRTWDGKRTAVRAAGRVVARFTGRRHMAAMGQSLAGRMRLALRDAAVPLWLRSPLCELVTDDCGAVKGVGLELEGRRQVIRAKAVVLATGGFDHNGEMRRLAMADFGEDWSSGSPGNTGDGIRAGTAIGAAVDLMDDAWWMPALRQSDGWMFPLVVERCIPRSLIVNSTGRRFVNESSPYVDFVHAQLAAHAREGGHVPAWLIMDRTAKRRYQFGGILPGQPFPRDWYARGVVRRAPTLDALAEAAGIPADALAATVSRFNAFARAGRDDDFHRGQGIYDRYYGDPTLPNPCLDVVGVGPFYAVQVVPGDLGTKGGLVTDRHARVLRGDGMYVAGLYATGNTSASVMGRDYPGGGATLGPAIAFGWLAARHAAGVPFDLGAPGGRLLVHDA